MTIHPSLIQYANSSNFQTIRNGLIDQIRNDLYLGYISFESFVANYINLDTCNSNGLDNWGRLLGLSRSVVITDYGNIFGLAEDQTQKPIIVGGYPQNFDNSTFFNRQIAENNRVLISDDTYREALYWRFYQHVVSPTIGILDYLLNVRFGNKFLAYVRQTGVGELTLTLGIGVTDTEFFIFQNMRVLPIPAGAKLTIDAALSTELKALSSVSY